MKKIGLISIIASCTFQLLFAQTNTKIKIGVPSPDFVLHNIAYYPKKQTRVSDFKGKWLVIDFWNKYCASCIEAFPHINAMQKEFGDKVQFMLVGIEDKENEIRAKYKVLHEKMPLELPCSFDSALANRFDIYGTPVTFIIDPKGVVRGVTGYFKSTDIADFLAGREPKLAHEPTISYDDKKFLLINGNGGNDTSFLYRSLLAQWDPSAPYSYGNTIELKHGKFEALRVDLNWLYKVAYLGDSRVGEKNDSMHLKFWRFPIVEINDSCSYEGFKDGETATGKGLYSYSLTVPPAKATRKYLMGVLQQELKNYFGYDVTFETRKIPCWKMVATEEAKVKLRPTGGPTTVTKEMYRYIAKNISIESMLFSPDNHLYPVFNATGIQGNIDITLDYGDSMNVIGDAILKAYEANGLSFVKGEIEMNALVIRDPKP